VGAIINSIIENWHIVVAVATITAAVVGAILGPRITKPVQNALAQTVDALRHLAFCLAKIKENKQITKRDAEILLQEVHEAIEAIRRAAGVLRIKHLFGAK